MTPAEPRRVPIAGKVGFGVGQLAEGLHSAGINGFLILYYQQVLGLPGTLAGTALLIAMIFDAFSDPMVGAFSDHVRTRFGRRHPFIVASAIPLGVVFFALFSPPAGLDQTGLFAWLVTFAVLERVALTFYGVPHSALGAEMAPQYDDRSTIFSVSTGFGFLGGVLGLSCAYIFFFPETPEFRPGTLNPAGYPLLASVFALGMVLSIFACAWGTRSEIPYLVGRTDHPTSFDLTQTFRNVGVIVSNRSFAALFLGSVFGALVLNIDEILNPYMGLHFWALPTDQIAVLPFAALLGLPVALFLAQYLPRVFDKRNTTMLCIVVFVIFANTPVFLRLLDVSWFPENGSRWIVPILFGRGVLVGCFAPVALIMLASMLADVCDEIELESGQRLEGLVFSARSFALKLTSGVGNWIGGVILDLIAFPTNATVGTVPEDVLFNLGLVVGPLGAGLGSVGLGFYMMYRLDRGRHAEISAELAERRSAREPESALAS